MQLAALRFDAFSDGVWLVDLASLTDPDSVALALSAVIGVHDNNADAEKAVDTARDALRNYVTQLG